MPFLWSENAAHIQTLFPPWAPADGYVEEAIAAFPPWAPADGYAEEAIAAVEECLGLLDEADQILGLTWIRRWGR
jgi:hypothetical protein